MLHESILLILLILPFGTMTHLGGNASTASIDNDVLDRSRNFYERRREGKKMVAVAIVTQ